MSASGLAVSFLHGVDRVVLPRFIDTHDHLRLDQDESRFMTWVISQHLDLYDHVLPIGNTVPPIANGAGAVVYERQILAAGARFRVIRSIFWTEALTTGLLEQAFEMSVKAVKLMFKNTSVNSAHGVPFDGFLETHRDHLAVMQERGKVLQIHAEHPCVENPLDREEVCLPFIREIAEAFPKLRILLAHASTRAAIGMSYEYENVWCEITLHHLLLEHWQAIGNHDHLCLPIPKTWQDRQELRLAAWSQHPRFIFGSDSAPHPRSAKNRAKGACGIFTAPATEKLIDIADECDADIERIADFTSRRAAELFHLEPSGRTVEFRREKHRIPKQPDDRYARPFLEDEEVDWKLVT